jgi:GNAT superfamily N-acetyltransferase
MEVIDLSEKHLNSYFVCLEEWSDEMKEAGNHKQAWFGKMKDKGLKVKLAIEGSDTIGMIQYVPVEHSFVDGSDLYFINCIWVHGHKGGVGNRQKKGVGRALLRAAEEDVRSMHKKGVAAWGISLPFWMKASWFKKHGYKKVDKNGMAVLLWKPFTEDAEPPVWIRQKKKPLKNEGKVTVTSFINGWCPAQSITCERAKRAAAEFGEAVLFQEINTFAQEDLHEWGLTDALYIDGKQIRTGPPPTYEKIRKKIEKRVNKLQS